MKQNTNLQNAKHAYNAYCDAFGPRMLEFEYLSEMVQKAWVMVYNSCVNRYKALDMLPLEKEDDDLLIFDY